MLSGESDGSEAIYIGECDSLVDRFRSKHHAMDKADWQQIALASTTDETFNKAHARRAEHLLVEIARSMRRVDVMTDQTSRGSSVMATRRLPRISLRTLHFWLRS
jgi:hypothetical protein